MSGSGGRVARPRRRRSSEAYQESKAKQRTPLQRTPFEAQQWTPLRRREAADALAAAKQRREQGAVQQRFFERQALGVPSDEREE